MQYTVTITGPNGVVLDTFALDGVNLDFPTEIVALGERIASGMGPGAVEECGMLPGDPGWAYH